METLFGIQNVQFVDDDGSPIGRKEFICWNPPLKDPLYPASGRISSISEASRLLVFLIQRTIRTIVFCKVRKACELLLRAVRDELDSCQQQEHKNKIMSYRGGYTPEDRRKIEQSMFTGELLGIIATNALELGVDIGSLGNSGLSALILCRCGLVGWVSTYNLSDGTSSND